jgi:hypothetical protein
MRVELWPSRVATTNRDSPALTSHELNVRRRSFGVTFGIPARAQARSRSRRQCRYARVPTLAAQVRMSRSVTARDSINCSRARTGITAHRGIGVMTRIGGALGASITELVEIFAHRAPPSRVGRRVIDRRRRGRSRIRNRCRALHWAASRHPASIQKSYMTPIEAFHTDASTLITL